MYLNGGIRLNYCGHCGELLMVEDEQKTGAKKRCPKCLWKWYDSPIPVVLVLVTTADGQIVYVRRKSFEPGMWSLISGYIEKNETAESAAKREVQEETGLEAEIVKYLGTYVSDRKPHELVLAYHCKVIGGDLVAGDDADEVEIAPPKLNRFRKGSIAFHIVQNFIFKYKLLNDK